MHPAFISAEDIPEPTEPRGTRQPTPVVSGDCHIYAPTNTSGGESGRQHTHSARWRPGRPPSAGSRAASGSRRSSSEMKPVGVSGGRGWLGTRSSTRPRCTTSCAGRWSSIEAGAAGTVGAALGRRSMCRIGHARRSGAVSECAHILGPSICPASLHLDWPSAAD